MIKIGTISVLLLAWMSALANNGESMEYVGMCDASAAVALDEAYFIVANDEDNILRIYSTNHPEPVSTFDASSFLGISYDDKSPETDIEGASRIGDYFVFITSHGRDKEGRLRKNRHRLFAVKIDKNLNIQPVGRPYGKLMNDIMHVKALRDLGLYEAYQPKDKKKKSLAPKKNGINIEGFAALPNSASCVIGFRNPIPHGRALLVIFKNPLEVLLEDKEPRFGKVLQLDLDGRGIRDIMFHPGLGRYLLIGGAHDSGLKSHLYSWSGYEENAPRQAKASFWQELKDFNPEAIVCYPDGSVQILSDDGTRSMDDGEGGRCDCKALENPALRRFRSILISTELLQRTEWRD